jgi:hypothetical protein
VLKKAGIVVATAAAGLLAVSPLAFAGDKDDHDGNGDARGHHGKSRVEDVNSIDGSNEGLINVAGNNIAVPVNVCLSGAAGRRPRPFALDRHPGWWVITQMCAYPFRR